MLIFVSICLFVVFSIFIFNMNNKTTITINRDSKVEDIKFEDNKVNVYFFWGKDCRNCEAEFEFLESIYPKYGKYFNVYAFEVWNNDSNYEFMNALADEMNDTVSGVPYTIISDKSFSGFGESLKEKIKTTIKEKAKSSYDVYKKVFNK